MISAGLLLRACVLQTAQVAGVAMMPVLAPGDVVLVSKISYGLRIPGSGSMVFNWMQPKAGDLVVVSGVGEPPVTVVRRIVATEGQSVRVDRGLIAVGEAEALTNIDCAPLDAAPGFCREKLNGHEYFVRLPLASDVIKTKVVTTKLGPGQVFVLSDDRRDGPDSRHFGVVPVELILGKADRILIPAKLGGEEFSVDKLLATPMRQRGWLWPVM